MAIRKRIYFNVTEHPTAQWTAQQIVEALPLEPALPRSPWQKPYVERPTLATIHKSLKYSDEQAYLWKCSSFAGR
ncbi:MAG: hypothetical protein KAU21_00680, partial [Gammaproteobacteria bacterium]|nr:hypothetical protein [Gammaproteobacteria bacterium]